MRKGISVREEYWQAEDVADAFDGLDFVFVAVDKTNVRTALCEALEAARIPFVDAGMGIYRHEERVRGSCQVFFSGEEPSRWRIGIPTVEETGEDEYRALQLADLGALTAALAVGMWRRHIGQYEDETKDWLVRYEIENNDLLKPQPPNKSRADYSPDRAARFNENRALRQPRHPNHDEIRSKLSRVAEVGLGRRCANSHETPDDVGDSEIRRVHPV